MSLTEGNRTNRDAQLDLSYQIREEFGETVFIDDHNEQHFRRIMLHARGGLDRLPKCCTERKNVRNCFPNYDDWLNKKFKHRKG